jgi:hypothetical protein
MATRLCKQALHWVLLAIVIGPSAWVSIPDADDGAAPLKSCALLIRHAERAEFSDALPAMLSAVVLFALAAARPPHRLAGSILIHISDPLHCRSNR